MNTAVQLRAAAPASPQCELVYGRPREVTAGVAGPIALFESGEIVAYLLRWQRPHLYVFRTLDVDDRFAASLPGVRPRVRLLLDLRAARQIRRARALFASLGNKSPGPSGLTDGFYVRVSARMGGRLPATRVLLSLLSPQPCPTEPWTP